MSPLPAGAPGSADEALQNLVAPLATEANYNTDAAIALAIKAIKEYEAAKVHWALQYAGYGVLGLVCLLAVAVIIVTFVFAHWLTGLLLIPALFLFVGAVLIDKHHLKGFGTILEIVCITGVAFFVLGAGLTEFVRLKYAQKDAEVAKAEKEAAEAKKGEAEKKVTEVSTELQQVKTAASDEVKAKKSIIEGLEEQIRAADEAAKLLGKKDKAKDKAKKDDKNELKIVNRTGITRTGPNSFEVPKSPVDGAKWVLELSPGDGVVLAVTDDEEFKVEAKGEGFVVTGKKGLGSKPRLLLMKDGKFGPSIDLPPVK